MSAIDRFLAARAVHEVKGYSGGDPFLFQKVLHAIKVEDMSTAHLYGRFCT
jgi:hypothetical protein